MHYANHALERLGSGRFTAATLVTPLFIINESPNGRRSAFLSSAHSRTHSTPRVFTEQDYSADVEGNSLEIMAINLVLEVDI
jgi:hypothetical protein